MALSSALYHNGQLDEALSELERYPDIPEFDSIFIFLRGKVMGKKYGIEKGVDFLKENYEKVDRKEFCDLAYIEVVGG